MKRLASMPPDVAASMRVSLNGMGDMAAHRVESGEWALLQDEAGCYALVSVSGNVACIEAVEGKGGSALANDIVMAARMAGMECEAWIFAGGRARLAARIGLHETGEMRLGDNGTIQHRVKS